MKAVLAAALIVVITTTGGVTAQPAKVARVGFLSSADEAGAVSRVEAFRRGLRELGHVEGQNLRIEYRWANGRDDRLSALAADLVRSGVDVIVTQGTPPSLAAQRATTTIPIVFAVVGDPVGAGLVASVGRPGGNVTGLTSIAPDLAGKRLELLRQALPALARGVILLNPSNPVSVREVRETVAAGRALGLALQVREASAPEHFEPIFTALRGERATAVIVLSDVMFSGQHALISALALKHRLPVAAWTGEFVESGSLMSYGPSILHMHRQAAGIVDRILKGTRPAEIPVEQPSTYELALNLRTAGALGLTIPPGLVLQADRVIR
jgi:putative ABC transport system substrate-binding protein